MMQNNRAKKNRLLNQYTGPILVAVGVFVVALYLVFGSEKCEPECLNSEVCLNTGKLKKQKRSFRI